MQQPRASAMQWVLGVEFEWATSFLFQPFGQMHPWPAGRQSLPEILPCIRPRAWPALTLAKLCLEQFILRVVFLWTLEDHNLHINGPDHFKKIHKFDSFKGAAQRIRRIDNCNGTWFSHRVAARCNHISTRGSANIPRPLYLCNSHNWVILSAWVVMFALLPELLDSASPCEWGCRGV